jgi:hypothetical protein
MNNRKAIQSFAAAVVLLLGSAVASAHNGIEHVMGTISAISDTSIQVKTVKNANVTVLIDPSTTFSNNDTKTSLKALKVGERVVVNAKDNAQDKLVAVSVRWGANSTAKSDHAAPKK